MDEISCQTKVHHYDLIHLIDIIHQINESHYLDESIILMNYNSLHILEDIFTLM